MTTFTAPDTVTDKNLDTACTSVVNEIGRTDGKSSLLLAFNGAVLAGLASVADKDLPTATKVFGALAVLALGA
ncbi:integral membrane plasmid transfer protein, partial [Streptomyces mirabilis]